MLWLLKKTLGSMTTYTSESRWLKTNCGKEKGESHEVSDWCSRA